MVDAAIAGVAKSVKSISTTYLIAKK